MTDTSAESSPFLFQMRRTPRVRLVPAYHAATIQIMDPDGVRTVTGHVCDLSATGARLDLDEPVSEGQRLGVCLDLPGSGGDIFTTARVVRVFDDELDPMACHVAIEFNRYLSEAHEARLQSFLGGCSRRMAA